MLKFLIAAAAALSAAAAAAQSPNAGTVVITADRMVDVLAGRVVEEPVIVATDGRIVSVVGRGRSFRRGRGGSTCLG
jgi:adenine deaminase